VRVALERWASHAPCPLRPELERVARRARLGAPLGYVLGPLSDVLGSDADALVALVEGHARLGGDAARAVLGLAASLDRRADSIRAARAAAAGARLSGRLVAALPLLVVPVLPLARAPLLDGVGVALLAGGVTLAIGGVVAIERLVPDPPREDGAALVADAVAGALRAGVGLGAALEAVAAHAPNDVAVPLRRALRMAHLGGSWTRALAGVGDQSLGELAGVIESAERFGLPSADALEEHAQRVRSARLRAYESTLRRAPVVMVVPLTLFVLPSFVLLGIAPFLRGLSLAG
jgi:tight adherence protein B